MIKPKWETPREADTNPKQLHRPDSQKQKEARALSEGRVDKNGIAGTWSDVEVKWNYDEHEIYVGPRMENTKEDLELAIESAQMAVSFPILKEQMGVYKLGKCLGFAADPKHGSYFIFEIIPVLFGVTEVYKMNSDKWAKPYRND
jgi:hypothetical protein